MSSHLPQLLPQPRLRELSHIDVGVPLARAYEVARHVDLARSSLARLLFSLRTLPARLRGEETGPPSFRLDDIGGQGKGFQVLVDEPESAFVVGAIGRFWEIDIPFADVPVERFAAFDEPGWGKLAWELRFDPRGERATRITFELRVTATDEESWRHFRRYFRLIGPFSRFIRRQVLGLVLRELESPEVDEPEPALAGRRVRERYDRIAPVYDLFEGVMEGRASRWRRELWAGVDGGRVIEVGVGTGTNLPYHPRGADITAIDISPRMLERARRKARRLGSSARLEVGDVERLPYPSGSFDVAVGTFLFCSVADPVAGLAEVRRVLKPGGRLLLIEHVLSHRPALRRWMERIDRVTSRFTGPHINRETVENVRSAGFADVRSTDLWLDVVQRIEAVAPPAP